MSTDAPARWRPVHTAWNRPSTPRAPGDRAVSSLVAVLVLLALTVALGAVVAVGLGSIGVDDPPPAARLDLTVDADTGTIEIRHEGGDALSVEDLSVTISVEGEPLDHQPPVPFFAAPGFTGGPEGPFNEAADPTWRVGEAASVRVAATNAPTIDPGDAVTVTVAVESGVIATLEATAT